MIKYTFLEKLSIFKYACFGVWEGKVKPSLAQRINAFGNTIIILFFIDFEWFYNHIVSDAKYSHGDLVKAFYMTMLKHKLKTKGLLQAFKDHT